MNQFSKISKTLSKAAAAALCFALLCSGCGVQRAVQSQKIGTRTEVPYTYSEQANHALHTENCVYVAKSGLIELYLDTVTYGVSIRETNTGRLWNTLPDAQQSAKDSTASVLQITLLKGGKRYTLNTQDNAVAFHSAAFKPMKNGVQVTYDLAPDEKTATSQYEALPQDAVYASVTVQYTVEDGALYVGVNKKDILLSAGCTLESLSVLNYFGAVSADNAQDYLFLPDGSGAIERLTPTAAQEDDEKIFVPYGTDFALAETEKKAPARLAVYGMKCGESAFAAWIQSGAEISEIRSHKKSDAEPYYRVGPTFRMQDVAFSGKEGKTVQHTGNHFEGEVRICYRFLSHNNASYAGMATACRELFMRSGLLSTKPIEPAEYLPFLLTAEASAPKKHGRGARILTDFEDLEELLALMKAKSINNILVRYNGALDGSLAQEKLENAHLLSALGNEKALESLKQYAATQKFTLFLNTQLFSAPQVGASADTIFGRGMEYTKTNPFAPFSGKTEWTQEILQASHIAEGVDAFVNGKTDADFGGYCIDDAGSILYTDYKGEGYSRLNMLDLLSKQAAALSAGHRLMVDTGNIYMLKNADVIVNLPSGCAYTESEQYQAVPFLQMLFHGSLDYAHAPLNLQDNVQKAFLHAVEYGAIPAYDLYFEKTGTEELDSKYHYDAQLKTAAKQYEKASAALTDLRDARMTDHGQLQKGVYYTEYSNSTVLYFNYNAEPVEVNSITIAPMDFLRVN